MEGLLNKFEHLKIQLEEIKSATNNFDDEKNRIGVGGFGRVYKGEMSHVEGRSMVAIKRLDRRHGQGEAEFLKEIDTLSRYKHENLISLLGFCYQGDEAILVYELASRGSLDRHINSPHLTWSQRLMICIGAGRGLRHLHDPKDTHQRLIHCDVKGGNILLDAHWNAKVADFGFSIVGPANGFQSTVITLAAGTHGYIDPLYQMTNTLTKESDVYSFGVVLFEVLFGRLCYTVDSNGRLQGILVPKWKEYYEEKTLNDFIFKDLATQPLEQSALKIFSDIAYRCLKESREDRPKMAEVVTELETAFACQVFKSSCYKDILKSAQLPLNYRSKDELVMLLSKGLFLNRGKTWFSLNKKGEHCEMINITECFRSELELRYPELYVPKKRFSEYYSHRFPVGIYSSYEGKFETSVQTQFLSLGITYTVNFVFNFESRMKATECENISLKYKLQGETESSIAYLAYKREDGWWMAELYQFTCDHKIVDLRILFDSFGIHTSIEAVGIEFRPLEKVERKEDENQAISDSDSDANWEDKLPSDYEDIIKQSENSLQWTTKEEAYSIMSKGFLINNYNTMRGNWFYLDKNGKKCHMLSAREVVGHFDKLLPLPGSRFGEARQYDTWTFEFCYDVESQLVSSQTTYAIYIVYKLSKDQSGFEAPMEVEDLGSGDDNNWYIYLVSPPQIPVIKPKADQNTHNPPSKLIQTSLPQQRNDGWMEVQLFEFQSAKITEMITIDLKLTSTGNWSKKKFRGLIVEGIEIRPK